MFYAVIDGALEALTHHRPHGATEKLELERAGHDGKTLERAGERHQRVTLTGSLLRGREAITITLAVTELQRILRRYLGANFLLLAFVQETHQALTAADSHVMTALRADIQIAFEL